MRSFHIAPDRGMSIIWFDSQDHLDAAFPHLKAFQQQIAERFEARCEAQKASPARKWISGRRGTPHFPYAHDHKARTIMTDLTSHTVPPQMHAVVTTGNGSYDGLDYEWCQHRCLPLARCWSGCWPPA